MSIGAGSHDTSPRMECGGNLALSLECPRSECGNALAALAHSRAPDEFHLPSGAREKPRANRVGADLSGEVHFDSGIDGLHMGVLRNDEWIVRVCNVLHQDIRIMVNEGIDLLTTQQEGRNHLSRINLLVRAIDDPFLDELEQSVCEHLRMQAKILMVRQLSGEGVWQCAYAHLQAVSVLDEARAILANEFLDIGRLHETGGHERCIIFHEVVEFVERDEIAISKGNVGIDDSYHEFGSVNGGDGAVNGGAEADHSVAVRAGYVHECRSELYMALPV